jgi:hypothetical protein
MSKIQPGLEDGSVHGQMVQADAIHRLPSDRWKAQALLKIASSVVEPAATGKTARFTET